MAISTISCPFCSDGHIKAEPGKTICLKCNASFEIDDKVECIFVDLADPRIPLKGTYCMSCGLVQSFYKKRCSFCETILRHQEL